MEEYTNTDKESNRRQRGRFMGKLFKEPKKPTSEIEVEHFLHGSSDKCFVLPSDQSSPQRSEQFNAFHSQKSLIELEPSHSSLSELLLNKPKRSKKNLVVRFSDSQPELIGEGGYLAEDPVVDVRSWKINASKTHHLLKRTLSPIDNQTAPKNGFAVPERLDSKGKSNSNNFQSLQFESRPDKESIIDIGRIDQELYKATKESSERLSERRVEENMNSSQKINDKMRFGEGIALVASRKSITEGDLSETLAVDGTTSQLEELHLNTMSNAINSESSRLVLNETLMIDNRIESSTAMSKFSSSQNSLPSCLQISHSKLDTTIPKLAVSQPSETVVFMEDEALNEFIKRTDHLFDKFRLHSEAVKQLMSCSIDVVVRVELWWFVKGRMNLEKAVKNKFSSAQAQEFNLSTLYQAYIDIAKSLWILKLVTSRFPDKEPAPAAGTVSKDARDVQKAVICSMRKLVVSMKRNNFFPPSPFNSPEIDNLDASIWALGVGDKSLFIRQRLLSIPSISGSLPLGDTNDLFHYDRIFAGVFLSDGDTHQRYSCPIVLSIIRNQKEKFTQAVIVNQDGSLNFVIQSDKSKGLTWADLKWHVKEAIIEICLPYANSLRLQCSQLDFAKVWRLYDYEKRTYGVFSQRTGEDLIYETVLRNLKQLNKKSHASFNGEELHANCQMKLYEKFQDLKAATGPCTRHQGFRVAVVTSPSFKNIQGIDLEILPIFPVEYSFLRGDDGLPAILLKAKGKISDSILIATFNKLSERTQLHSLLINATLGSDEKVIVEGHVKYFSLARVNQKLIQLPQALELQGFKFINQKFTGLKSYKTVFFEKLRMILEFKYGTITDRVNVGPGELKLRLDPCHPCQIQVLRHPQTDWTILIETQAPKNLVQELEGLIRLAREYKSIRLYTFPSLKELHLFQLALTGFEVLFDEVVTSFNISRRRMVVPIYKKWDAILPRIQVVKNEKVTQLLAFFENFSHGDCMNFVLRSTDVFECSTRNGKYSLRIVDAKFTLPKVKTADSPQDHEFVCLDMPDYHGEHDDISIHFENEDALERLIRSLPAKVRQASRISSVRK